MLLQNIWFVNMQKYYSKLDPKYYSKLDPKCFQKKRKCILFFS